MIQRCTNPKSPDYADYGERGITVCARWNVPRGPGKENVGFLNFLADMGERPAGMTIDRIKNNRGYFKNNCRWSTPAEQARNRRKPISISVINSC